MSPTLDEIRAVKRRHEDGWMALDDVVAVGVGVLEDGRHGIVVSVSADPRETRAVLPREVDGVPVEVRAVGDIRAL